MDYSERCSRIDDKKRKACGWGGGAWVGINYAAPVTVEEGRALELVKKKFPRSINVHVYELVEFLSEILAKEK